MRATLFIDSIVVACPSCGEPIPTPDGSQIWPKGLVLDMAGQTLMCLCGARPQLLPTRSIALNR
jgi:hypothetical protein